MGEPVWHLFVVRHPRRDVLQRRLSEAGVDTIIHYPIPPHLSGASAADFERAELPVAERLAEECGRCPLARTWRSKTLTGLRRPCAMPSVRRR